MVPPPAPSHEAMSTVEYYKFDAGGLPDELFHADVSAEKWLATTTTASAAGFPKGSFNVQREIDWDIEVERLIGIALYMIGNVFPFLLPVLIVSSLYSSAAKMFLWFVLAYVGVLWSIEHFFFSPWFLKKYRKEGSSSATQFMTDSIRQNQYAYTERNISKYLSMNFVWPKSLHRPAMMETPMIFCIVPHGVAPLGITAYPLWSKLWNDRICHWTAAPMVMKIPIVGYYLKKIGYIPAKAKSIHDTLTKKEENVGIILDGIAGMFQTHANEEIAYLKSRKGIVKIALRAGSPIIPVYAFGHTTMWTVVVDPFGLLEKLSNLMGISLTPFFGRFGWFLGPPRRVPVTVCLGEPIACPLVENPTKEKIDEYHQKMLDGFTKVFDKNKAAYGWADKRLIFV